MSKKNLKLISYIYMILPVIIFVLGFIKNIYAIPMTIGLLIVLFFLYRQIKNENEIIIDNKSVIGIFIAITILCILAGQGNFFYQSNDYNARNAIFRDLIQNKWPVYYEENNSALVYYIGQWMVPALIGKVFLGLGTEVAFMKANVISLFWNVIGVTLCCVWVINLLKLDKKSEKILSLVIFFSFSGLDIIGCLITGFTGLITNYNHLEWWASTYQYSSMITQLFWVFNQCIVTWLIVLMFLGEKRVNNYMLLILLCLPFGPIPFIGLIIVFGTKGIILLVEAIKDKKLFKFIKDIFSVQNILSLIILLPIYYSFYAGNAAVSKEGQGGFISIINELLNPIEICKLMIFWFLEVGVYGIFLIKEHKKNPMFYVMMIGLIIIPLFQIGYQYDFSMRASIPLLLILNYWIIKSILRRKNQKVDIIFAIFIIVLSIGTITPMMEFYRGINYVIETKQINNVADNEKTLSNKDIEEVTNFVIENPKENSMFFKYLAK